VNDNYFISGILIGILIGLIIAISIYAILEPVRVETASDLQEPDETYEIIVDDLMFHCTLKPVPKNEKLRLLGCAESYGRTIIIKEYTSYSVDVKQDG